MAHPPEPFDERPSARGAVIANRRRAGVKVGLSRYRIDAARKKVSRGDSHGNMLCVRNIDNGEEGLAPLPGEAQRPLRTVARW